MKKSTIFLILLVYIASFIIVGLFGIQVRAHNEIIYVENISLTAVNQEALVNSRYDEEEKKYKAAKKESDLATFKAELIRAISTAINRMTDALTKGVDTAIDDLVGGYARVNARIQGAQGLDTFQAMVDKTQSNIGLNPFVSQKDTINNIKKIASEQELYAPDLPVVGEGLFTREYAAKHNITIINEYGIGANARITEVIETWDNSGYNVSLTFEYKEVIEND